MLSTRLSFVALWLANALATVHAQAATGGSFQSGGNTKISALMMFLGNENSVYILDKAEGNAAQILGHPAWGAVWDISTRTTTLMDIKTNSFCASGMHLPNGSFASFGGNDAVGVNGSPGSQKNSDGRTGLWDAVYQDFDGRKAIRLLKPCTAQDDLTANTPCGWFDEPSQLSMKKNRWYSGTEALGDGSVLILGGMVTGGYVNGWVPDTDPVTERGSAENTYEYYPARAGGDPPIVQFLVDNSPLNVYSHMYLMSSGKVLVQAGTGTMLWDHVNNVETRLPDMPNGVVRVYPASGAVAMLPLTKANQWTPTVLFCGGSDMPLSSYGDYVGPRADTWTIPASKDCQRLTPEPTDGSAVAYEADDDLLDGRTMGQFIMMPDGKMLIVNGGAKGTAGYAANGTPNTPASQMPFGVGLAADPVLTPAIYDPSAPKGSRWSNAGLSASKIPRLYHSTALLLPDASILIAGSNPNPDVDLKAFYPTEYRAEVFYPPYFNAPLRPAPTGMPKTLSYGGDPFDITIPATSYTGPANDAADNTTVVVVRGGFTTHAMNMGQRFLQLDNSYTVNQDGSITLHVAQMPPNANIFQPGPALMFVVMNGIPSNGTYVIIGTGSIGAQPLGTAAALPANVRLDGVVGGTQTATSSKPGGTGGAGTKANDNNTTDSEGSSSTTRIAAIAGAVGGAVLLAALAGLCIARRRRASRRQAAGPGQYEVGMAAAGVRPRVPFLSRGDTASSVFSPINNQHKYDHEDDTWDPSTASLNAPYGPYRDSSYRDSLHSNAPSGNTDYYDATPYDPYAPNPSAGVGFPSPSHPVSTNVNNVHSNSNLRHEYSESS